jgi:hypothetical protein
MDENQGKALREHAKPTVIEIGDRKQISSGRWNDSLVADYVIEKGQHRWIKIGELSRFAYGNGSIRMKHRARQCLAKLFRFLLLERGTIMISDVEDRRIVAVKIYNGTQEEDRQHLRRKIDQLQKRYDLTDIQMQKARDVVGDMFDVDAPDNTEED